MKTSYLEKEFKKTAAQKFSDKSKALESAYFERLEKLRSENEGASKEKKYHLERQILPGIAIYETLQTVMPKDMA